MNDVIRKCTEFWTILIDCKKVHITIFQNRVYGVHVLSCRFCSHEGVIKSIFSNTPDDGQITLSRFEMFTLFILGRQL